MNIVFHSTLIVFSRRKKSQFSPLVNLRVKNHSGGWNHERPSIVKANMRKKNKVITLPDFRQYYKTMIKQNVTGKKTDIWINGLE